MSSAARAYPRGVIEAVEFSKCVPGGEKRQKAWVKDHDRWVRVWHAWRFGSKSGIDVTLENDPNRADEYTGESSHFSRTPPGYQSFAKFFVEGPIGLTELRFEVTWPDVDAAYSLNGLHRSPPLVRELRQVVMSGDGRYIAKEAWRRREAECQLRASAPRKAPDVPMSSEEIGTLAARFLLTLDPSSARSAPRLAPSNDRDEAD